MSRGVHYQGQNEHGVISSPTAQILQSSFSLLETTTRETTSSNMTEFNHSQRSTSPLRTPLTTPQNSPTSPFPNVYSIGSTTSYMLSPRDASRLYWSRLRALGKLSGRVPWESTTTSTEWSISKNGLTPPNCNTSSSTTSSGTRLRTFANSGSGARRLSPSPTNICRKRKSYTGFP